MSVPSSDAASDTKGAPWLRGLVRFRDIPALIGRPAGGIDYIPQIDGLRFLSIILVMVWHASLRAARHADQLSQFGIPVATLYNYVPHGEIGVDFFFFISAYVITQLFLVRRGRPVAILDFYRRRARRIYPPYVIIVLICFAILFLAGYKPASAPTAAESTTSLTSSFLASLFYMHGLLFGAAPRLNPPMWSLEIEIQFYLLSPLLWMVLSRLSPRRRVAALWVALAVFVILPGLIKLYYPMDERFRSGLFTHMYLFTAGALAAEFDLSRTLQLGGRQRAGYDILLLTGLVLLLGLGEVLTSVDATPAAGWPNIAVDTGILLGIAAIFLGAMRGRLGRLVFGYPWICLVGTMCYSIYLTHVVVMQGVADKLLSHLHFANPFLIWGAWFCVLLPTAIAVGAVFYVFVERPFMSARRSVRT